MEAINDQIDRHFRHHKRRESRRGMLLVLPAFVFLVVVFILPIGLMMFRAVDNSETAALLPRQLMD
ncbi:hypothetical protein AJ87_17080 [Rhizobium yanglingense]|nr:hypothetical protein AJ87_17080 [Rhizobium yanglingense]